MIISIFTPHGGCPERCRFCDQSVSGGTPVSTKKVQETIEAHLKSWKPKQNRKNNAIELAFYGGTFTAMPKDRQLAYLDTAKPYFKSGQIQSLRISTRPDAIDPQWIEHLISEYSLKTVELGVQSFNPKVLAAIGRTHSVDSIYLATRTLKNLGLLVSLHMMIGCPGESNEDDALTIQSLIDLKPDMVRIHPLVVIQNTALAKDVHDKKFIPIDLEQAVARAAFITHAIEAQGIKVIRLGLQTNEVLEQSIVAGPFHPAFGDLVRKRIENNPASSRL